MRSPIRKWQQSQMPLPKLDDGLTGMGGPDPATQVLFRDEMAAAEAEAEGGDHGTIEQVQNPKPEHYDEYGAKQYGNNHDIELYSNNNGAEHNNNNNSAGYGGDGVEDGGIEYGRNEYNSNGHCDGIEYGGNEYGSNNNSDGIEYGANSDGVEYGGNGERARYNDNDEYGVNEGGPEYGGNDNGVEQNENYGWGFDDAPQIEETQWKAGGHEDGMTFSKLLISKLLTF